MFAGYDVAVGLVSIMIAVSGIIIGIGIAIDDRKLKEFGRGELYQAIINGVIVGSLFVAFAPGGIITSVINSAAVGPSASSCTGILAANYAICFAHQYLVSLTPVIIANQSYPTLMDSTLEVFVPMVSIYGVLSFISSIEINALAVQVGFSTMLRPAITVLNYIISALSMTITSLEAQGMLLYFIAGTALPILLPIGLVLRTFYFTRRLGGSIMAITIALFAIFPLTYVLDAQLIATYSASSTAAINSMLVNATAVKSGLVGSLAQTNMTTGILTGISNSVSSLFSYVESGMESIMSGVAMIIVEAFFLPIFSIMLTVVSARELARILGSEISFGKFDIF